MQTWEVPWASMRRSPKTFHEASVRVKLGKVDVSSDAESRAWRVLD